MPFYCKIDIEGNDIIALQTIENSDEKPPYISVETECLGENETIAMGKELETLERLYQLGYRRFKLVDQQTLTVLSKRDFYFNIPEHHWTAQTAIDCRYAKEQLELTSNQRGMKFTDFFPNASGPFGEELAGRWYGYKLAREILKNIEEIRCNWMNRNGPSGATGMLHFECYRNCINKKVSISWKTQNK